MGKGQAAEKELNWDYLIKSEEENIESIHDQRNEFVIKFSISFQNIQKHRYTGPQDNSSKKR